MGCVPILLWGLPLLPACILEMGKIPHRFGVFPPFSTASYII